MAALGTAVPATVPRHVRLRPVRSSDRARSFSLGTSSGSSPCTTSPGRMASSSPPSSKRWWAPSAPSSALHPQALVASMLYYWVPDQMCSVRGVEKLQPGTWAEFRPDGSSHIECYWDVVEEAAAARETHYDLGEVIEDSVTAHLVSDVPVSSFLSGGLDSSIVTVLAKRANPEIDAYTITFRAQDHRLEAMPDDAIYARKIARRHGIALHEIELQPDVVDLLPRMVDILDEPTGDPAAINTLLMSEGAHAAGVKVLLSGMGADELFGGYRKHMACVLAGRYRQLPGARPPLGERRCESPTRDRGGSRPPLRTLGQAVRDVRRTSRGGGLPQELQPVRPRRAGGAPQSRSCSRTSMRSSPSIAASTRTTALPTRWTACAWPTHDCSFRASTLPTPTGPAWPLRRKFGCPFVDPLVFRAAFSLTGKDKVSGKSGKVALKRAAQAWLPDDIVHRPKASFSAPLRSWVTRDLRDVINDSLLGGELVETGFLNRPAVAALVQDHRSGREDRSKQIWQLLTLEFWYRQTRQAGVGL